MFKRAIYQRVNTLRITKQMTNARATTGLYCTSSAHKVIASTKTLKSSSANNNTTTREHRSTSFYNAWQRPRMDTTRQLNRSKDSIATMHSLVSNSTTVSAISTSTTTASFTKNKKNKTKMTMIRCLSLNASDDEESFKSGTTDAFDHHRLNSASFTATNERKRPASVSTAKALKQAGADEFRNDRVSETDGEGNAKNDEGKNRDASSSSSSSSSTTSTTTTTRKANANKSATTTSTTNNYPSLHVKTDGRIVAIGDLHGDIQQARRALRIAGVLGKDDNDHVSPKWVGGNTVLVQVGDVLDRGDDEIGILILLQKLGKAARKEGGDVFVLNGNHEVLNISGDFRYVSRGAFHESMRFSDHLVKLFGKDAVPGRRRRRSDDDENGGEADEADDDEEEEIDEWRKQTNARVGLFSPGGPLAQQLSMHHTVLIINDTVFAHGGLVPRHVDFGLDKLNRSVSDWMRGKRIEDEETKVALGMAIGGVKDSVVWHRAYGTENYATNSERQSACTLLTRTLDKINEIEGIPVKRLVVGHTPQMQGANCECDGKIWRVDVGMSFGVLGANPQVLEIVGDQVQILTKEAPITMSKL